MKLIYLSSAITLGDRNWNYYVAAQVHIALMRAGFAVINPMATMTMPEAANVDWETWLQVDERIIEACDCVLRLPLDSRGADREVAFAESRGIPVLAPEDFPCLSHLFPTTVEWLRRQRAA